MASGSFSCWPSRSSARPFARRAAAARRRRRRPTAQTPAAASLARFIPEANFLAYVEFQGLDTHAAVWRSSAAYKVLNATKFGTLLADLAAQGIDAATGGANGRGPSGAEVVAKAQLFIKRGAAVGISREAPGKDHIVCVFRGSAGEDVRGLLDALAAAMASPKGIKADLRKGTRTLTRYGEGESALVIWAEKADVVLCDADSLDNVLATIDGRRPSAEKNAIRTALARSSAGYTTIGLAFVDPTQVGPLPPQAAQMGLDRIKRIELRIGFSGDALMSAIRVVAATRTGVLGLFDQPAFDISSLPSLPPSLTGFTVISLDAAQTYDKVVALIKQSDPATGAQRVEQVEQSLKAALGFDVRRDLLPHIGPRFVAYSPPTAEPPDPKLGPAAAFVGLTLGAEVKDPQAVAKKLEAMMGALGNQLKGAARGRGGPPPVEIRRQERRVRPGRSWLRPAAPSRESSRRSSSARSGSFFPARRPGRGRRRSRRWRGRWLGAGRRLRDDGPAGSEKRAGPQCQQPA